MSIKFIDLLITRARKVNKVKIFSGLYYIIKRIPTLVSRALEPFLVNFIGQNFGLGKNLSELYVIKNSFQNQTKLFFSFFFFFDI